VIHYHSLPRGDHVGRDGFLCGRQSEVRVRFQTIRVLLCRQPAVVSAKRYSRYRTKG
jgi:hypothetical protein